MNFKGFLRIYAEVSDYTQAFEIATTLLEVLKPFAKIKKIDLEQYWKIKKYYGISFSLESKTLHQEHLQLLELLGNQWSIVEASEISSSAVWNAGNDHRFVDSKVRWANFEYWQESVK